MKFLDYRVWMNLSVSFLNLIIFVVNVMKSSFLVLNILNMRQPAVVVEASCVPFHWRQEASKNSEFFVQIISFRKIIRLTFLEYVQYK
jgi:hypothetical protein